MAQVWNAVIFFSRFKHQVTVHKHISWVQSSYVEICQRSKTYVHKDKINTYRGVEGILPEMSTPKVQNAGDFLRG